MPNLETQSDSPTGAYWKQRHAVSANIIPPCWQTKNITRFKHARKCPENLFPNILTEAPVWMDSRTDWDMVGQADGRAGGQVDGQGRAPLLSVRGNKKAPTPTPHNLQKCTQRLTKLFTKQFTKSIPRPPTPCPPLPTWGG